MESLTEATVQELIEVYQITAEREADSDARTFLFGEDGHDVAVWYVDAVTLENWRAILRSMANISNELFGKQNINLWR